MDIAASFATIVGLLCNFKSENRANSDDKYEEFTNWLDAKRHKTILEEIQSNHQLALSLRSLLNQNNETLIEKLSHIEKSIVELGLKIPDFKEIASLSSKHLGLSDQAISILQQLEATGGSKILEIGMLAGKVYQVTDGKLENNQLTFEERRFIEDDFDHLCSLGLLTADRNKKGDRLFKITRGASYLVKQIQEGL